MRLFHGLKERFPLFGVGNDEINRLFEMFDCGCALARIGPSSQEVVLEAGSGDDAIGVDAIECQLSGAPLDRVAFNPDYLLEGLSAINQPVTNLAFTNPNKPAVLTGAPNLDAPAADGYLYLLMPVRLPA